jgi:hypothetical protein
MARAAGRKRSKKAADTAGAPGSGAARLEKALAASLKREAKAASRLEAVQLEVAVLRAALAEVAGEGSVVPTPDALSPVEAPPSPKPAAVRPRAAKKPAATKTPPATRAAAAQKPAAAKKPAATVVKPAPARRAAPAMTTAAPSPAPAPAQKPAATKPAPASSRARRPARPGLANGALDR